MAKEKMTSGATGSLGPVRGVASVGMDYKGGEGGGMKVRERDVEHGTNKGSMEAGRRGGSMNEGERSHKHAMPGHRVHDEHIKTSAHGKTHLSHAVESLKKHHSDY